MKKIYNILFVLFSLMAFAACTSEVDDAFDKTSAQRINEAITEYKNVLISAQNGWLMKYFPKANTTYGGYSVFVKFAADGNATVTSDILGSDKVSTSHFKLEQSAGVVLSFDEYNEVMHYFSDPKNPDGYGTNGKGMEGDFEFRIVSVSAEKVVLTGKKHGVTIVMTPVAADASYKDMIDQMLSLEDEMYFPSYECKAGDATYSVSVSNRVLEFSREDVDEDPITAPYVVTTDGIEFYEPIVLSGDTVKEFKYVGGESYEFGSNSANVKMYGVIPPLTTQLVNGNWFFSPRSMGSYSLAYWNKCNEISQGESVGESMSYCYLGTATSSASKGKYGLVFVSAYTYAGCLYYDATPVDDSHITLTFQLQGDNNGVWYYNNAGYKYIVAALGGSGGKTYSIEADNLKSPTQLKLVDESNPQNYYILTRKVIYDPFE